MAAADTTTSDEVVVEKQVPALRPSKVIDFSWCIIIHEHAIQLEITVECL